jgi:hypothetical protein
LCEKFLERFDVIAFYFWCLVIISELMKAFNGATCLDNDFTLDITEFVELVLIVWKKNVSGEFFSENAVH